MAATARHRFRPCLLRGEDRWKAAVWLDNQSLTYALSQIGTTPSLRAVKYMESVMGHWALSAAAAVAILASGSASSAQVLISGKYVLDRAQSDDVHQAIESAGPSPSNFNWVNVRGWLLKSNFPTDGLRISSIAGRFSVGDDSPKPLIDVWTGGAPIKWKLNDGQVYDVSAKADGEAVLLTFRGLYSERTTIYRSVGQQLVVETTIISPDLSAPIRYKLVYNQAK
jgi:hypothetical protein